MHRAVPAGLLVVLVSAAAWGAEGQDEAVQRALRFLSREVPSWSVENKCYSCHNNGDAARALYTAVRHDRRVEPKTLSDTTQWLLKPAAWEHNGGEGEFNDKRLAVIQFAHTLLTAVETGAVEDKTPLVRAAQLVAEIQDDEGSWTIEPKTALGTPATYGTPLATAVSLRVLTSADARGYRESIERGRRWLREFRPRSVVDAAGVLLGLAGDSGKAAKEQRNECLEQLKAAQGGAGGWGSYASAPAEPFDTAVAVLALQQAGEFAGKADVLARGRKYLLESQTPEGNWPETTRPSGAVSYAQRLSTTGWCSLALLATEKR